MEVVRKDVENVFIRLICENLIAGLFILYMSIFLIKNSTSRLSYSIAVYVFIVVVLKLFRNGFQRISFYKELKKYHRKNVKIRLKNDNTLQGTLFIQKNELVISNLEENKKSYSFIHKKDNNSAYTVDNIEEFTINGEKIEGMNDYFKYLMDKLGAN